MRSKADGRIAGQLERIRFGLRRKAGNNDPLKVEIAEDPQGEAGAMARLSVYVSVMAAGLQRQDHLAGVQVSIRMPGNVDASSVGAALCLATLSALDSRELPRDVVVIGTILPDGTVGPVDDIASRVRAAQGKGLTRVLIPDYLRFQKDDEGGGTADIETLAKSQQMECAGVENVEAAYCALHRIPYQPRAVTAAEATNLPKPVMDRIAEGARTSLAELDARFAKFTDEDKEEFENVGLARYCVKERLRARNAYSAGRLNEAWGLAVDCLNFLRGRDKTRPFISSFKPKTADEAARGYDKEI
jgi:hypothetical protein